MAEEKTISDVIGELENTEYGGLVGVLVLPNNQSRYFNVKFDREMSLDDIQKVFSDTGKNIAIFLKYAKE